jgi:hypothetical protein
VLHVEDVLVPHGQRDEHRLPVQTAFTRLGKMAWTKKTAVKNIFFFISPVDLWQKNDFPHLSGILRIFWLAEQGFLNTSNQWGMSKVLQISNSTRGFLIIELL